MRELVKNKNKGAYNVEVSSAQKEGGNWIIEGAYSIRIEGLPWPFNFKVCINNNGTVVSYNFNA